MSPFRRAKIVFGPAYIVALVFTTTVIYRLGQLKTKVAESLSLPTLTRLSPKAKIIVMFALVIVLGMAGTAIYWQLSREPWVEQPVMLRVFEGEIEINTPKGEGPVAAADKTSLGEGYYIRAKQDSTAELQYFDGSAVYIEGPAELFLSSSRFLSRQYPGEPRTVGLEIFQGKITVTAARQASQRSVFEVRTPTSVGRVQATLFELDVQGGQGDIWEVSRGTVMVGALISDTDQKAAVALVSLNAGDSLAILPLPEVWQEDWETYEALLTAARDIVAKSIREGRPDVQVGGTSLLAFNPDTGSAIFRVDNVLKLAPSMAAAPQLPPDYQPVEDEVLNQWAPGLVLANPPALRSPFIPVVSIPEAWAAPPPPVVRKSPPGYLFSIYDLEKPLGVAVDPAGQRICVTQSGGERVTTVYDGEGNKIMVLVPPGTVATERDPFYVAIDRMGTMYVSDRLRHTIDMYDANGVYLGVFANRDQQSTAWSPLGLALDLSDNLYITDVTDLEHRVMMFDQAGDLKLEFGKEGDSGGEFSFPNDVAVDSNGLIYVADSNNFRIQVFDSVGQPLGDFSEGVGFPRGIEIEGSYLYVVDTFGHLVRVYDLSQGARQVFAFGERGVGDGEFNFPNGLALDSAGRVYITDRENNRVQVWSY